MDYKAAKRVQQLLNDITDGTKHSSLANNADNVAELKSTLKHNPQDVEYLTPLLLDRLAANHSQTRKLCVDVAALLFSRSRVFRQLLTQHFTTFVELSVGHRSDQPLPAPPAAAQALRARALEVIEEWHEAWGAHYPQVTVAYRYLKKQYKFPEIASRAAALAAEAAARMRRHQELLLQRYTTFVEDFPQQRAQLDGLVQALQQCFQLLQEQPPPQQPPQQQQQQDEDVNAAEQQQEEVGGEEGPNDADNHQQETQPQQQSQQQEDSAPALQGGVGGASGDADQQWEDVPAPAAAAEPAGAGASAGSLPAAAADGGDFDLDELVGDYPQDTTPSSQDAEAAARDASLLDQLSDLTRQAALAVKQPLLDALRLLTQVQMQEPSSPPSNNTTEQQQQRQQARGEAQQQQQGGAQEQQQQQQRRRRYEQWQQQRQGLLRDVVQLRAQLQALIDEAASTWGVSAPQVSRQQAHTPTAPDNAPQTTHAGSSGAAAAAAAASLSEAALTRLPSRVGGTAAQLVQQQQQEQQTGSAGLVLHHASAGGPPRLTLGSSLQQRIQQQHTAPSGTPAAAAASSRPPPVVRDVYAELHDPTVAVGSYTISREVIARNEQLKALSALPGGSQQDDGEGGGGVGDATAAAAGGGDGGATATQQPSQQPSQRPSQAAQAQDVQALKRKLLASAPRLPISGEDWLLAEYAVTQHGMELYNHWGAVDASVGLPKDRLGQLVGYSASYFTPQAGAATAAAAAGGRRNEPEAAPERGAAGSSGGSRSAGPADTGAAAAVGAAGTSQSPSNTPVRAQGTRQAASAHNRAVLAGAFGSDEAVAAALQKQLDEEAAAGDADVGSGGGGKGGKGGRARKAPERKGDKIRRKLLG